MNVGRFAALADSNTPPSRRPLLAVLMALAIVSSACSATSSATRNRDPHGPADVQAYIGNLESRSRDKWQKPDEVIRTLKLAPNAVVADVGCGPGYFTRRLAKAVPNGVVYAVDVEPRQLDRLNQHLSDDGVVNVVPVLAALDDPRLPPGRVDLVLVVDSYHHFQDRPDYLGKLKRALAPGGRLVIIDYHKREMKVGPPVEHKLAREIVLDETTAAGFRVIEEPTVIEYQYFLILEPTGG